MGLHKHAATVAAVRMIWVATVLLLCTAVMGVTAFELSRGMAESGRSWAGAIKSSFGRVRTALHSVSGRGDAISTAIQPSEGAFHSVCFEQDHAAPAGADSAEYSKSENGDTEDLSGQEDGERGIGLGRTVAAVTLATTAVGLAAAPILVPAAVGAVGFGAGGIVAGSWAAGLMSTYGGAVAGGSVCATLQSMGAAGALAMSTTAASEVAAILAGTSAYILTAKGAAAPDEGCMHEDQVVEEAAPTCPLERDGDDGVEELHSPSASSMQH